MDIIDIARKLNSGKTVKQTYNLFNSWNMNENDHTKMLLAILNYCDVHGQYPVLTSFLERFTKGRDKMIHYKRPQDVKIRFGKEYIDGLITFTAIGNKYAVIIENKIYNATDQKDQVRRYIETLRKGHGVELCHIWAFYITGDGSKEISMTSYDVNKEKQETNIGNRFVVLNYSEDILKWLNEDVIKPGLYPEALTSVARVYSSYLSEYLFCSDSLDEDQVKLLTLLKMPKALDKLSAQQIQELYKLLNEVQDARQNDNLMADNSALVNNLYSVTSSITKRLEHLAYDEFEQLSVEILNEQWAKELKKLKTSWKAGHRCANSSKGYLQIRLVDEWNTVHVEWKGIDTKRIMHENKYSIVFHVESNPELRQKCISELKDILSKKGFKFHQKAVCFEVSTQQPLFKMEREDLRAFLKDLYTKQIHQFFKVAVDKYQEYCN